MGVDCGDQVEQTADDQELGAVVAESDRDGACSPAHHSGENIEQAEPELAGEAEDIEDVASAGRVNFALQAETDQVHAEDRGEEEKATSPFAEEQVAGAGYEPSRQQNQCGEAGFLSGNALGDLLCFSCHRC